MKEKLTAGEHEQIVLALRDLRNVSTTLSKLEACGDDCSVLRSLTDQGIKRAEKILENFSPQ